MEEKWVYVGIFWAIPSKEVDLYGKRWDFIEEKRLYPVSGADANGFIDYPYSHFIAWDDMGAIANRVDCYFYPRGRVLYNTRTNKHLIFADECLSLSDLFEIVDLFEIADYEIARDEHYISAFTKRQDVAVEPLRYNILRGNTAIGENLIEIMCGETKMLVELGKSLNESGELSDIEKQVLQTKYDAVVISHYHTDHAGLIDRKTDCPIYMGSATYRIMRASYEYAGKEMPKNIFTYHNKQSFMINGIKITPILCDHSAFDSYMLLFERNNQSILYTGDFRFHGRKNLLQNIKESLRCHIDTLIYDGTNLGTEKYCISEQEIENKAVEVIKSTDKRVFILQSATNIDRLVSFYRVAKRCRRIFYEDDYSALIATAAGGKIPRPDVFDDVFAYTPKRLQGKKKDMFFEIENKRGLNKIADGKNFVMLVRSSSINFIKKLNERLNLSGATLIYSMWSGYKAKDDMAQFLSAVSDLGIKIIDLHTSGHAPKEDVELLKRIICADEYIPIHTNINHAKPIENPTQN